MSDLLKRAFEVASKLPESRQDELAAYVVTLCEREFTNLSADEAKVVAEAEAEIARGEVADPEAVAAFWRRHNL